MIEWLLGFRARKNKKLELNKYKKEILKIADKCQNEEIKEIADFLKSHQAKVLNYSFVEDIEKQIVNVMHDNEGFPYVIRNNKRLYFPQTWNDKKICSYYKTLLEEQHESSPHLYLTSELKNKHYRTVLDLGGAEGVFALDMLELADKIYIFEADSIWMEPLERTFAEYKDKIVIVPRFISDYCDDKYTTLDAMFENEITIDLIKMDIEGAEPRALIGGKNMLQINTQTTLLICAYHSKEEGQNIQEQLGEYKIRPKHGYMLYHWNIHEKLTYPYLRRGVLEVSRQ